MLLCFYFHCSFSVCKGCAGLINIIHSDILCDHVPDFNIDGFNVFSLTFWKATSETFRALNSLHFSFALSRKYKSSIYYHNYFMSEYQRRFLLQQPFTAYSAADVPVIWVAARADNPGRTDDYGVQIHCFSTKLYRLSRAVPLSTDRPLLRFFLRQFSGSHQKNIFAETPQLKLCKTTRSV